mgnify:FL=1
MDNQKWTEYYTANKNIISKTIFIKVMTSDGKHFFFHQYDDWYDVKKYCEDQCVQVKDFQLQFRSNKCPVDVSDGDGIYFVRSVLGTIGMKTKEYFTVGVLKNEEVHKEMWLVPELLKEKDYVDQVENCFEEAMIRYEKKKEN